MTDAEYLFKETEKDRKRIGYGAKNKKRGGGRYVRTPSDNLSKKEKEAMNGEIATYNISKRMTWDEFKAMPLDLQQQHVNFLQTNFNIGADQIGKLFGLSAYGFKSHMYRKGLTYNPLPRSARPNKSKLNAWIADNQFEPIFGSKEEPPESQIVEEPVAYKTDEEPVISIKQPDIPDIAAALAKLVGTGAKITIEITL